MINFLCLETKKVTKKIQEKMKLLRSSLTHPRHFFLPTHFPAESGIKNRNHCDCVLFERIPIYREKRVHAVMTFSLVLFLFCRKKKWTKFWFIVKYDFCYIELTLLRNSIQYFLIKKLDFLPFEKRTGGLNLGFK